MYRKLLLLAIGAFPLCAFPQTGQVEDDELEATELEGITIQQKQVGQTRLSGAENGIRLDQTELFKAACCSLGESFVNNASTDVNYSDAATGAKQVKLMGLSGTYVQLLGDALPIFRGVASPFALDYVPGTFMKSLSVSKGASSVKNGYESVTGQINVEYLKPDDEELVNINLYADSHAKLELNADANHHFSDKLSAVLMGHYENGFHHKDDNGDGFADMPMKQNFNLRNHWKLKTDKDVLQFGGGLVLDDRESGQLVHSAKMHNPYEIGINSSHYNFFVKNALFLNKAREENVAVMAAANWHNYDAQYGHKAFSANQQNLYAQAMYEAKLLKRHGISAGLSFQRDDLEPETDGFGPEVENVAGAYAQYTYQLGGKLTGMAGVRADHSSLYGAFVTPRFHLKYSPTHFLTLRGSAGKGYRSPHAMAQFNNLLASGRQLVVEDLKQEEAWNSGLSSSWYIKVFGKTLTLNAEYFYTTFAQQTVVDYERDERHIYIGNLEGDSYSHTAQIDAGYELFRGMTATLAYRLNDVRCSYNGVLRAKPLTNRYKALMTLSYKTPLELWQFDANLQLNGGGRLPTPYLLASGSPSWQKDYDAYPLVNLQVTREFRHFSVYVGGENLTNFKQEMPIYGYNDPFGTDFEPTLVWGPVTGIMFYAGIRAKL